MAWAEAALEEMGLAQIWVRRGQRAQSAEAGGTLAAASGGEGGASAVAVATDAATPRSAASLMASLIRSSCWTRAPT